MKSSACSNTGALLAGQTKEKGAGLFWGHRGPLHRTILPHQKTFSLCYFHLPACLIASLLSVIFFSDYILINFRNPPDWQEP